MADEVDEKAYAERLKGHYNALVRAHGNTPQACQWFDMPTQYKRFAVLADISPDIKNASILDIGCGTGSLLDYLHDYHNFEGEYTGVDISEEAIAVARQSHKRGHFIIGDILDISLNKRFDYVLISGLFNNRLSGDTACRNYLERVLTRAIEFCRKGMAFNAMSTYVDYQTENLCYFQPEEIFRFCKKKLSPCIALRHDYRLKEGIIPYEFAVYIYTK